MNKNQRKGLAKALYDIGKLIFAAAVLGQILIPEKVRWSVVSIGFIWFVIIFIVAVTLDKGEEK